MTPHKEQASVLEYGLQSYHRVPMWIEFAHGESLMCQLSPFGLRLKTSVDLVRIATLEIALFVLVLLSGCGGDTRVLTSPKTFFSSASDIPVSGPVVPGVDTYDKAVKALMVRWNLPGITVAVVRNGHLIVARGYGYADYETKQPMQPDTRMRIASASKTFTAVAILHLLDEGKLNLDNRFLDILTQYQVENNGDQRLRAITIRHLLQHSGGWDRSISPDPMGSSPAVVSALGVAAPATCSDTIRYMMGKKLDFDPGAKFAYSNFGYCILGRVIEKLSGKRYEDYVRDEVLTPMEIHGMSVGRTMLNLRGTNEARYYDFSEAPLYKSIFPGGALVECPYGCFSTETGEAAGGWVASSIDLTRFITALDGTRGSFLSPAAMADFTARPDLANQNVAPSWNAFQNTDGWYGMGIFTQPDTTGLTWWHWGNMAGTDSVMLHNGRGYVWAAVTNTMPKDIGNFMIDLDRLLWNSADAGVQGSPTDLYQEFPSPSVPASGVQN